MKRKPHPPTLARSQHLLALLFLIGAWAPAQLLAQPAGPGDQVDDRRGLEIAVEADRRDTGFGDHTAELTIEDISSQEVEKYTYTYVGEKTLDGVAHYVIERYPVDPKSGYTKQVVWYDQAEYRVQKIDYYDRKEALLKTLTYHGYQQYLDQYWRADEMRMVNHQTGKSTELLWTNYQFQTGLTDRDFDQSSLKRVR